MAIRYDVTNYEGQTFVTACDWQGRMLGRISWHMTDDPATFTTQAEEAELAMESATDKLFVASREIKEQFVRMKLARLAADNIRGQVIVGEVTINAEEI